MVSKECAKRISHSAGFYEKVITLVNFLPHRKYPVIQTDDERERYKAVFQDQFSEYKELSAEVQAILRKFDELDAVMSRLPHHSGNQQVSVGSCLGGALVVKKGCNLACFEM